MKANIKKLDLLLRKRVVSSILFLSFMMVSSSMAQDVNIKATIDSSAILIGDQTTIHVDITHPPGILLDFPIFRDTLVSGVEIVIQNELDTLSVDKDRIELRKDFLITSFDSGQYVIPPFEASFRDSTISGTFVSNPLFLQVSRPDIHPADTSQQIFDIKQPYGEPVTLKEALPYIMGGITLLILSYLIITYFKRKKKDEPILRRVKPREPADVIALRELDKLKSEKLWQQDKVKIYYTRLTEILRRYLENRYGVEAMEQTSNETLESLVDTGFNDNNLYEKLKKILFLADMAKFAKAKPLASENETSMLSAYIFVNETREAWKKTEDTMEVENSEERKLTEE